MKSHINKSFSSSASSHSKQPFFDKSGEGSFFSKSNETEQPFFNSNFVQPKLNAGAGNPYERQADEIPNKTVQRIESVKSNPSVQTKCDICQQDEKLQGKEEEREIELRPKSFFGTEKKTLERKNVVEDRKPIIQKGKNLISRKEEIEELSFGNDQTWYVNDKIQAIKIAYISNPPSGPGFGNFTQYDEKFSDPEEQSKMHEYPLTCEFPDDIEKFFMVYITTVKGEMLAKDIKTKACKFNLKIRPKSDMGLDDGEAILAIKNWANNLEDIAKFEARWFAKNISDFVAHTITTPKTTEQAMLTHNLKKSAKKQFLKRVTGLKLAEKFLNAYLQELIKDFAIRATVKIAGSLGIKIAFTAGGTVVCPVLGTAVGFIIGSLVDTVYGIVTDLIHENEITKAIIYTAEITNEKKNQIIDKLNEKADEEIAEYRKIEGEATLGVLAMKDQKDVDFTSYYYNYLINQTQGLKMDKDDNSLYLDLMKIWVMENAGNEEEVAGYGEGLTQELWETNIKRIKYDAFDLDFSSKLDELTHHPELFVYQMRQEFRRWGIKEATISEKLEQIEKDVLATKNKKYSKKDYSTDDIIEVYQNRTFNFKWSDIDTEKVDQFISYFDYSSNWSDFSDEDIQYFKSKTTAENNCTIEISSYLKSADYSIYVDEFRTEISCPDLWSEPKKSVEDPDGGLF